MRVCAAADARTWLLSAMMKVVARLGECPPLPAAALRTALASKHNDMAQV
jgi:hypothetical protein